MAVKPTRADLIEQNEGLLDRFETIRDEIDDVLENYGDEVDEPEDSESE